MCTARIKSWCKKSGTTIYALPHIAPHHLAVTNRLVGLELRRCLGPIRFFNYCIQYGTPKKKTYGQLFCASCPGPQRVTGEVGCKDALGAHGAAVDGGAAAWGWSDLEFKLGFNRLL